MMTKEVEIQYRKLARRYAIERTESAYYNLTSYLDSVGIKKPTPNYPYDHNNPATWYYSTEKTINPDFLYHSQIKSKRLKRDFYLLRHAKVRKDYL